MGEEVGVELKLEGSPHEIKIFWSFEAFRGLDSNSWIVRSGCVGWAILHNHLLMFEYKKFVPCWTSFYRPR